MSIHTTNATNNDNFETTTGLHTTILPPRTTVDVQDLISTSLDASASNRNHDNKGSHSLYIGGGVLFLIIYISVSYVIWRKYRNKRTSDNHEAHIKQIATDNESVAVQMDTIHTNTENISKEPQNTINITKDAVPAVIITKPAGNVPDDGNTSDQKEDPTPITVTTEETTDVDSPTIQEDENECDVPAAATTKLTTIYNDGTSHVHHRPFSMDFDPSVTLDSAQQRDAVQPVENAEEEEEEEDSDSYDMCTASSSDPDERSPT
eukprot:266609_1